MEGTDRERIDAFDAETIARAQAGDAVAGREAIQTCIAGLCANRLSEQMRFYLARCLSDLLRDVKPSRAMNIEVERGPGRPRDPFPAWEEPLAAFGALLHQRGYIAARIEEVLDQVRQSVYGKALDIANARRMLKKYEWMRDEVEPTLLYRCGYDGLQVEIQKYPTVTPIS